MPYSSIDSAPPSPPESPGLPATSSTSRLILLPDTDDRDPLQDYTTDDEDDSEDSDPQQAIYQQPILPLTRSVVFLYLLSPYLRLGAIYTLGIGNASLTYGVSGLVVAASLSAFCRQIWFLLGRYLRKSSTEDILIHIFARRHRRGPKHGSARYTVTIISGLFRLLIAAMYLRDSVDSALQLKIPEFIPSLSRVNVAIVLSILVFVLSLPRSLASRSLVYTTGFSVASYVAWLVAVSRSNAGKKPLQQSLGSGVLWNEISSIAFACTTVMTIPLFASLMAGMSSVSPTSKNARARSFQLLNVSSTILAVILLFPLLIIAQSPRALASRTVSENVVLFLRITTLVLSIPSVVVSITSLPLHGMAYRFIRTDLALSLVTLAILALSLVPPTIAAILDDLTLFVAVFGAFLLPALTHITVHYFHRPLSIVVPREPSSVLSTPRTSDPERSPSPSRDPLLQRKERLLQRKRLGKRVLWDIIIWIVLLPICICALVWAVGRLTRRW